MLGMGPGYTFLAFVVIAFFVSVCVEHIAAAWRARGVEREKTKQVEIKARTKEVEANAKIVESFPTRIEPGK